MHRLVPELISANLQKGCLRGSYQATAMFLDVSGFSVMTDALMGQGRDGAEALAATMRGVLDPMVAAIHAHGGMVVGFAGDSITALFPSEPDRILAGLHALAAAGQIQESLRANPAFPTPYGAFRIAARAGLAEGEVSWGILLSRTGDRAVYYFRGPAVEESARAEHAVSAGETALSEGLRRQLGSQVKTQPLSADLHLLQGLTAPLPSVALPAPPEVDVPTAALFSPGEVITRDLPGEFRQTVHVFMRIPDVSDDALDQFAADLFDEQARYGGLIERIDFGDKGCTIDVLWGAPAARENDIDRALNFTLALQARASVPVTAGITYYNSFAGYIGGALFETYTTYGWGISMAARFMMTAADGEIWVDERIAQRAEERFGLELVGERAFKGFARKQKVYILHGRKQGSELSFQGAFFGRDAELSALTDFVNPIWRGRYAGVVGIWGEAGMGKTRLVHEFRRSTALEGRSCLWALCHADEILRRSLNPLRHWLLEYFGLEAIPDRGTRLQRFAAKFEDLSSTPVEDRLTEDLRRGRAFLAPLVDLEWPDPLYDQLDAQGRYDNTILALIALIKAESLRQPIILFFDDAQYLDEDSQAFVPRLKRALTSGPASYPVAILMSTRWQGTRVLLEEGLTDRDIDLPALSDDSIAAASAEILDAPISATLVRLVNDRAEGNPFYAEQTLRYLFEKDLLERSSGIWDLKPGADHPVLPADIRAMLTARLDQFSGPVKDVIQAASVLGRVFELAVLKRMLAPKDTIEVEIAAAERAGIWSPLGETRYIFTHELFREAAYHLQLQSRRRELHARAFELLQQLHGTDKHRHIGALAYHSEQAGLAEQARHYLQLAGDAARDGYHTAQALDLYRRALGIRPAADLDAQFALHRERERIIAEHGTLAERSHEVGALEQLATESGESRYIAEAMLLRARLHAAAGDHQKSADLAARARELALTCGRPDVVAGAHMSLLDASYERGLYAEAIRHGEEGLAWARQQQARTEEGTLLNKLGMTYLEMKNPSTARTYFEQSMEIFRAADNMRGVVRVLTNLGSVAGYQGHYGAALDAYQEALRLAREMGARIGECRLLGNIGWISGLRGDYEKARTYAKQGLLIAREIGDRYNETISLINLSSHSTALGEAAAAVEYGERGLALARQSNHRNLEAWALTYLGQALLALGRLEEAQTKYQDALEIREELGQSILATEPGAALARILYQRGDEDGSKNRLAVVLDQLEQDGTLEGTDQPLRVYLNCHYVLTGTGDPRAKALLKSAHEMLKTRANGIADPAERRAFLEKITDNREIQLLWESRNQETGPTSSPQPDLPL